MSPNTLQYYTGAENGVLTYIESSPVLRFVIERLNSTELLLMLIVYTGASLTSA